MAGLADLVRARYAERGETLFRVSRYLAKRSLHAACRS
jgi:hypothetical protein